MDRSPIPATDQPRLTGLSLAAHHTLAASLSGEISDPLEIIANLVFLARNSDAPQNDRESFLEIAGENIAALSAIIERYAIEIRTASSIPPPVST